MSDILIRLATVDDAAFLPDIERSAGKAFLAISGLEWIAGDETVSAEVHQSYIDEGRVWVAISENRCVGFVTTAIHDDSLHIVELAVEDGYQGKGIGRRLMASARDYATEAGLQALTLTTFRDLPFNEHFYQKLGYQTLVEPDLPERLADILETEIENGLPGNRRCAMRLVL